MLATIKSFISKPTTYIHYTSKDLLNMQEISELKAALNKAKEALSYIAMIDQFTGHTAEKMVDKARKTLHDIAN